LHVKDYSLHDLEAIGCKVRISHLRKVENGSPIPDVTLPKGVAIKHGFTVKPKGGITTVTIQWPTGYRSQGYAICSDQDNFSRKIGREIALGRAQA
jgi:hypothetical protein